MTNRIAAIIQTRSRRELLIIAVLVVFLIIVAAVLALTMTGGDDDALDTPLPPSTARPRPTPTPTRTTTPVTPGRFDGRDPFQPLVVAAPPGGGDGSAPPPGQSGGPGGPNPTGRSRRVTLVDIFTQDGDRMATVTVGAQEYTVGEGDRFADNFEVVDITARCATVLFGDQRFTLCIGQEVQK